MTLVDGLKDQLKHIWANIKHFTLRFCDTKQIRAPISANVWGVPLGHQVPTMVSNLGQPALSLQIFEHQYPHWEIDQGVALRDGVTETVLFGMGCYESGIAQALRERGCPVLGVDYSPELVHSGDAKGHPVLYGDAEDPEFVSSLTLARTRWVASTARERHVSQALIHTLQSLGYTGRIAVTAYGPTEVARLEQARRPGVGAVVDAAREATDRLLGQVSLVIL